MKQIICLSVLLIFALSSCNAKSNETKSENQNISKVKTINLTKEEFIEKIVNYEESPDKWLYLGDKPAIIDFYADWCGPCRKLAPTLNELATQYEGEIYIYKVDVEKEKEIASVFGIQSLPSILFVPLSGNPVMVSGVQSKKKMDDYINSVLLN